MSQAIEKSDKLAKRASLQPHDPIDLFKAVAMDIGKQVAHHIEIMYPEAVKAASSTFLLSVRGCAYNEIMAAIAVEGYDHTVSRLDFNKRFRRYIKAAYRNIRRDDKVQADRFDAAPCEAEIVTRLQECGISRPEQIAEAASHLRVALLQAHPDDDQIILGHVREALKLLEEK